jgi:hypothetical protein
MNKGPDLKTLKETIISEEDKLRQTAVHNIP